MHAHFSEKFLTEFHKKHGRPPKILHVGNIANNAYLNAKFLNEAGFDCDVLCYDYFHIMGCPEWEDANFQTQSLDHFAPDWNSIDLGNFNRPTWFAQGSMPVCVDYLVAKNQGKKQRAALLWSRLGLLNKTNAKKSLFDAFLRFHLRYKVESVISRPDALTTTWTKFDQIAARKGGLGYFFIKYLLGSIAIVCIATLKILTHPFKKKNPFFLRIQEIVQQFPLKFPDRQDKLVAKDCFQCVGQLPRLSKLFRQYDLVHAYATDGVWPMLADFPYVAFEHGTIRNIPFESTAQGRLCAATYRFADSVIITNADNHLAAQKLHLDNYHFVPHPVNDAVIIQSDLTYENLHHKLNTDFIVFHPARQHWDQTRHSDWEKGNDFLIRAFADFVKNINGRATAIFVEWGKSLDASKALIKELEIDNRVTWIQPIPHQKMVEFMNATDVVADQFYLGAFGSTMPKALACSRPAMLYVNASMHEWCFPEPPPIVNVRSEVEILEGLKRLYLDKDYYQKLCEDGHHWYEEWHSRKVIVDKLAAVYDEALTKHQSKCTSS